MSGSGPRRLAVVGTPIGNLADLAPRAAEVLAQAELVLCEDTRHSKPLLDRVGSRARLVSCHAHNERERKDLVIEALRRGERVALVTDAGAPSLSDPGGKIVEEVVAAGLAVEVLPGPTALTAALMGAGIDLTHFAFLGFLPKRGGPRRELLDAIARTGFGVAIYEAPQRVEETLVDLGAALGPRRVVVARELTKLHETFHRGTLPVADEAVTLTPAFVDKGEVVLLVEAGEAKAAITEDVDALARDVTLPPKERAKRIAKALGIPVKQAYERVQRAGDDPAAGLVRVRDLVAAAAAALAAADAEEARVRGLPPGASTESKPASGIPGADALMALLAKPSALRAPVEGHEAAKALLAALSAVDALVDAVHGDEAGEER